MRAKGLGWLVLALAVSLLSGCARRDSEAAAMAMGTTGTPLHAFEEIRADHGKLSILLMQDGRNLLCEASSPDTLYVDRAYRDVLAEIDDGDHDIIALQGVMTGKSLAVSSVTVHGKRYDFSPTEETLLPGP